MKTIIKYIALSLFLILLSNCSEDKIELSGRGTITGKVVSVGDNVPLENTKISTSPVSSIVFTNEDGDFTIPDVEVGTYSVQAEKDGFLSTFESANVIDNASANVIFELDIETANNDAPDAPVLNSPENNAVDQNLTLDLVWTGIDPEMDDLTYEVEVLNDQNTDVLLFTDLTDATLTLSGLNYGTKYFWQVSASDGINSPVLSDVFSFNTIQFPENRIFFTRKINGNNVIFSTDEAGNELQLTSENANSWRPRKASNVNKLAFLKTDGGQTHVYTMNLDGSDVFKVTNTVAVNGFNQEELDFEWKDNNTKLVYPSFDALYEINASGSGLNMIHQTANGNFISEVDWNQNNQQLALKTNDASGYNIEIYTITNSGALVAIVLQGVNGGAGGLDFSFDGNKLLYTYDVSANENAEYRQLDSRLFIYDFTTLTVTDLSVNKVPGTNDLDPKFSPNEAEVIYVNTSNDGISQNNLKTVNVIDISIFTDLNMDAKMPDWK